MVELECGVATEPTTVSASNQAAPEPADEEKLDIKVVTRGAGSSGSS
jgi:hypothetical protein